MTRTLAPFLLVCGCALRVGPGDVALDARVAPDVSMQRDDALNLSEAVVAPDASLPWDHDALGDRVGLEDLGSLDAGDSTDATPAPRDRPVPAAITDDPRGVRDPDWPT